MLIGELSRRSGVPPRTLRFYEGAGVLAEPDRTAGGYRDYGDDALDRLAFIRSAQAAGLTLVEIRGVVAVRDGGTPPCSHVVELLEAMAAEVDCQRVLRELKRELTRLRSRADAVDPAACDPRSVCEVLSPPTREALRSAASPLM